MQAHVGKLVWDTITGRNACVIEAKKVDGVDYYQLEDVPLSPKYPTGWRYSGEIEDRRFTDMANSFEVLMEMIWEGGAAYDLTFPIVHIGVEEYHSSHNACHMLQALFPKAWKDRIEKRDDGGVYFIVTLPDKSQLIVGADGDRIEQ